jgi:Fe-S cluster assembly iron-binding protein IscA
MGSVTPRSINIAQNTVLLYFYSDASVTQSGFNINWASYSPGPNSPACLGTLGYGAVKNCGSDFTGSSGRILSPSYPINYDANSMCNWNINAPAVTVITLNITYFYTEQGTDYFHVLLPQACSPVIKPLAGRLAPQAITVPQNNVSLFFRSDSSISYTGFTIDWYATPTCSSFVRNNLPTNSTQACAILFL